MSNTVRKNYKFKLLYFEDRGSADLIRLMFAVAQHHYEPIQIKLSEWNHYRAFMPFEQLPVLVLNDDIRIAQTNSICRFLASYFKLSGCTEIEAIQCDMINEQLKDCTDHTIRHLQEFDHVRKVQQLNRFKTELLPRALNGYEKLLSLSPSKFLVGNTLTWADLALVNAWEWLDDQCKPVLGYYPLVKNHNDFVRSIPKVAEWLKEQKPLRVFKIC